MARFAWLATMQNKKFFAAIIVGAVTTISAFFVGQQLSTSAPEPRSTPNALCFRETAPDQFSPKHVETKLIACQIVGMTKAEAIAYIESFDLVHRIAMEDVATPIPWPPPPGWVARTGPGSKARRRRGGLGGAAAARRASR